MTSFIQADDSNLAEQKVAEIQRGLGIRQKEINGRSYQLTLLPADTGAAVFFKLFTVFAPAAGSMIDSIKTEDALLPEEVKSFTSAAMYLVSRMSDIPDLVKLVKVLVEGIQVGGKVVDFNEHFRGNYGELILCLEWSLRENFEDAFTVWIKEKGLEIPTWKTLIQTPQPTSEELSEE